MPLLPRFSRHVRLSWSPHRIAIHRWIVAALVLGWCFVTSIASAQETPLGSKTTLDSSSQPVDIQAQIGLDNQWKLGQSTAVSILLTAKEAVRGSLEIEVADGDGVRVAYRGPAPEVRLQPGEAAQFWLYPRIGRADQPIVVRFTTDTPAENGSASPQVFEFQIDGTPLPPTQPWVAMIGDSLGVETLSVQSLSSALPSYSTSVLDKISDIPDQSIGLMGVDVLVISTNDLVLLQNLSNSQQRALSQWVSLGGQLILSFGPQANEVARLSWLADMIPGKIDGVVDRVEPQSLESYIAARSRLESLTVASLADVTAETDLTTFSSDRRKLPTLLRGTFGLGRTTILTVDLAGEAMAKWPDRGTLMQRLLSNRWEVPSKTSRVTDAQTTSFLGYDDLTGQLRGALEYFPSVKTASFSQISALLLLFLIFVGPLDYWLIVYVFKRPQWTWWSLSIVTSVATIGLISLHQAWKPVQPQVNIASIVDIDIATSQLRGQTWFHLYSGMAQRYDIQAIESSSGKEQSQPIQVDWQGLPGRGLGSMESGVQTDRGMPRYNIELFADSNDPQDLWSIRGLGIPSAGTKSLQGIWHKQLETEFQSSFKEISGADQLEGEFLNNLPYSLMDGYLVYHTWAYALRTRIRSGDTVKITADENPKDLTRRLVRRTIVDGNDVMTPWSPANRDDLDRIVELFLFHQAAGGPAYSGLSHRYQPWTDLTELSRLDRAILVARLEDPVVQINYRPTSLSTAADNPAADGSNVINSSGGAAVVKSPDVNRSETWIRIILPVNQTNRS